MSFWKVCHSFIYCTTRPIKVILQFNHTTWLSPLRYRLVTWPRLKRINNRLYFSPSWMLMKYWCNWVCVDVRILRWRGLLNMTPCFDEISCGLKQRSLLRAYTFAVPGRREFDYQSLPGGGEFAPHALGVWNLNCTLDRFHMKSHGGRGVRGFSLKRLCLCGQLATRKGLKQALCSIWRYLDFNIFNVGFRLWIQLFRESLSEKVHATIPKGIVGGFEFAVLQRNLKEWHKRPWTYVFAW